MPTVSRSLRSIIACVLILFALGLSNSSRAGDTITFCGTTYARDHHLDGRWLSGDRPRGDLEVIDL